MRVFVLVLAVLLTFGCQKKDDSSQSSQTEKPSASQRVLHDCQGEINRMREIYIVILGKIPAMPPLAQLSQGIVRALNDAESSRDAGNFNQCVVQMREQIQIVEGYTR